MHLDSGQNFYLGRSFYQTGPTTISHRGSPLQSQEQLYSFLDIQNTIPDRPFACQGWALIKRKISSWFPEGLLVSCNKRYLIFIERQKCEVYSSPTWRAIKQT